MPLLVRFHQKVLKCDKFTLMSQKHDLAERRHLSIAATVKCYNINFTNLKMNLLKYSQLKPHF